MIPARFRRISRAGNIRALYGVIVTQARTAAFYTGYGVPETVQGRFDLIVLHLVLVLYQLSETLTHRHQLRRADRTEITA